MPGGAESDGFMADITKERQYLCAVEGAEERVWQGLWPDARGPQKSLGTWTTPRLIHPSEARLCQCDLLEQPRSMGAEHRRRVASIALAVRAGPVGSPVRNRTGTCGPAVGTISLKGELSLALLVPCECLGERRTACRSS